MAVDLAAGPMPGPKRLRMLSTSRRRAEEGQAPVTVDSSNLDFSSELLIENHQPARRVRPGVVEVVVGKGALSTPENHLAAGPHRRVGIARGGRAGGEDGGPNVGGQIITRAVV